MITGGGRGIGAATALHLAGAGHDLAIGYRRDRDAAESTAAAAADLGARAIAVRADVTGEAEVARLFDTAAGRLGPVTGLVNNAGATLHVGDLADTPVDVIRRVLDLDLAAVLLCCRRAAQVMSTSRGGAGGAIVNVSSAAATLGSPHEYVHYAAAKAGVDALTVGLAQEVAGEGIRVVGIAPGIVRTRIHEDAGDAGRLERVGARVPLGRAGEPGEVAGAIAWLMSDEASYVTGTTLRVAGGR